MGKIRSGGPARTHAAARAAFAVIVVAGLSLAGCGREPGDEDAVPSGAASSSPTAACPRVEEMPDGANCAVYDPDAAMAENRRYKQQMPISPEVRAEFEGYVGPARTALESLKPPASADDVERALGSVGLDEHSVQTDDAGNGVRFGASTGGGCVKGSVSLDGIVNVSTGGFILDGGCLAMSGH